MAWRLAKSLEVLRAEINAAYPNRRKSSDGTIGDEAHASRSSDHNPWVKDGKTGVVTAIDFTHDPDRGVNSQKLAEAIIASKDDRIKYVISNKKICASTKVGSAAAWTWRPYTGSNPHNMHMHLSVKSDKASYDDTEAWGITAPAHDADAPAPEALPTPESVPPSLLDKIVPVARSIAGTAFGTAAAGQVATTVTDSPSVVADKVTSVVAKSGEVISATTQTTSVAKPGLWNGVLSVVSSPGFLVSMIVLMGAMWFLVWFVQKQHQKAQP